MWSVAVVTLLLVQGLGAIPSKWWSGPPNPVDEEINSRIINGVNAQDNQFPYMVSLKLMQTGGHTCGGSIITPSWVLTAAHCCESQNPLYIYAGSVVLSSGGQSYGISQVILHQNYDPNNRWRNDICLIRINGFIQLNDKVTQVYLPPQDWPVYSGDSLLISGWGYTTATGQQVVPDRMQVGYNFLAYSNDECGRVTGVDMFDGFLCVQPGRAQGACNGDSGSPLMKNGVQVGIASWVFKPCGSGQPDFYVRVPAYITWIQYILGAEAKDLKIMNF